MNQTDVNLRLPCGTPYAANGSTTVNQWQLDSSVTTEGSKVFTPRLPTFSNSLAYAAGYMMPPGDNGEQCRVFFPGKYTDDVVITDNIPTYFVSGIFYFEKAVRISGNANVVAGSGSVPGCVESDAVAVADAINAPFDAYSNGVGATFVFGLNGRLVIDNAVSTGAAGMSFKMNRRLVDKTDPDVVLNDISIMSVNGVLTGSITSPLDIPGRLNVPVRRRAERHHRRPRPVHALLQGIDAHLASHRTGALRSAAVGRDQRRVPSSTSRSPPPTKLDVKIPGYISVPQGTVSLSVGAGCRGEQEHLVRRRRADRPDRGSPAHPPAAFQMGLLNPVVQKTFKIVTETTSGSPKLISTALVQVNETGGNAVNSWVVQTI